MTGPAQIADDRAVRQWKVLMLMQSAFNYATLSNLLRLLGAGVLVASVSIFLMKGWATGNDIERYLMLLAHTVVLGVAGIMMGHWVKEGKGARLFLALALVSAVVNFAVLGGLVFSQIQWDADLSLYPSFARWQAGSTAAALTTAGFAWVLLAVVVWTSFMVLARSSALRLTGLFMASGSLLLIPLRQTDAIAAVVFTATVVLLLQVTAARRLDVSLATPEGRFACSIVFVPVAIMVGRGMALYSADIIMFAVISALVYLVLRQLSSDPGLVRKSKVIVNRISVVPAMAAAFGLTGVFAESNWLAMSLYIPAFVLFASVVLADISMRAVSGGAGYRRLACLLVAVGMLVNLWIFPGLATAVACLVSGLAISVFGYSVQQRIVFVAGLVTLLVGVMYQCRVAFAWFDWGNWTVLAVVGIVAIVTGSLLERHGAVLRARLINWRQSFRHWQH